MLRVPGADDFGRDARIGATITQQRWIDGIKSNGCIGCHQLGQHATRTIPDAFGTFASSAEAWRRRVQSGQSGQMMLGALSTLGPRAFEFYGDWTDRIANGALPHATPDRPQGVERNIVVTLRDWMTEQHYLHDLIASDRRNPTVNAYGPLYGSPEYSSDEIPILDPIRNTATTFTAPVRDADMPLSLGPGHAAGLDPLQPSAYWGDERIWNTRVNNHNSCSAAMADSGWPRRFERRRTRRFAARVLPIPRRSSFPQCGPTDTSRCSTRRPSSTLSLTPALAPTTCSSGTTRTTRCGRAGADRWWAG
jgi:hypothetical protein